MLIKPLRDYIALGDGPLDLNLKEIQRCPGG
jgi:hypothetical protein